MGRERKTNKYWWEDYQEKIKNQTMYIEEELWQGWRKLNLEYLPVIWDRAGSINILEWETFWKGYMGGNKVRKEILTAFSRNLAIIASGEDRG